MRTEAAVGEHFDSTFEQLGEILFEADHVEERSSGFDVDENVDVAVRPIVAARDRPEHADITDAVTAREFENLATVGAQTVDRHETIIAARRRLEPAGISAARASELEAADW